MMYHHFDHLVPTQLPPHWQAGAPIDLLPALRAVCPGCLDDAVIALQLHRPIDSPTWLFRLMRVGEPPRDEPVERVTEDRGDNYDYSDNDAYRFPPELIARVLDTDRWAAWQELLGIFKPTAVDMLSRVRRAGEADIEFTLTLSYTRRLDFLRSMAVMLSEHVASNTELVPRVVERIKGDPAWGLRDSSSGSRWDELVDEARDPSLLSERMRDDVATDAWSVFRALPRAVQVAVWFDQHAESEFPGGGRTWKWDPPGQPVETFQLFEMDRYILDVVGEVMYLADREASVRESLVQDDPEDEDAVS